MNKALNLIKNNKIKIIIAVILIVLIAVGIYFYMEHRNKNYDVEEVSKYNYYQLNNQGKYGVISISGNVIIEPVYDSVKIPNPEKDIFICQKEDKVSILNKERKELFAQYEEVSAISINGIVSNMPYEKRVLKYKLDGKYGLIDYNGKVITKPIYEEIEGLENKESELLVKKDGKYGVINDRGTKLIQEEYDSIAADGYYTKEDKYALSGYIINNKTTNGYRYGYINCKLEKILNVEYNSVNRILEISEGKDVYIIASKNGKYGVIKNNKNIINYDYQGIEYDDINNVFKLQRNLKYGVTDLNGKEIIPIEYDEIAFNGIYIQAIKNDEENYTYFNSLGSQIKNSKYTYMLKTSEDNYYITIDKEGLYGIINKEKKELVENKYSYIEYLFDDYFIAAKEDGKLGIINTKDSILVDFKYEVLQKIDDTNVIEAKILTQNKSELYGKNLEKVCSVNNSYVSKEDNYIKVYSQEEIRYFDYDGKELTAQEVLSNNKLFASKKDNKWGFINKRGDVVVDYIYDKVTQFNSYGFAGIMEDGKWGVINQSGTIVIEPTYDIQQTNTDPEFLGEYYKVYYGYGQSYYTNQISE